MRTIKILSYAPVWFGLLAHSHLQSEELSLKSAPFTASQPVANFPLPLIVIQYDPVAKTGANWKDVNHRVWYDVSPTTTIGRATNYLREGLDRLTGKEFQVLSSSDLSKGIVVTLLKDASPDIRNDPSIQRALTSSTDKNHYGLNEAFYLKSEKDRLLIVANTPDGLSDAVSELLESVDYEVLGMGPDWTYVPDYRNKALVFNIDKSDRPSFYIRQLWAHSSQPYGYGTIMTGLTDPTDEPVDVSYERWLVGTRMWGKSMASFPSDYLQVYHRRVMDKMRELGSTEGFYAKVGVGPESSRPAAGPSVKDQWWINTDPKGTPGFDKIYFCDGNQWKVQVQSDYFGANLDLSVPFVRQIVFEDMKRQAEEAFKTHPDDPVIIPTEVEDGGVDDLERAKTMAHKNWYPEYLAAEKLPFGRPYVLNGYKGIDQPKEFWDCSSASDQIFGFSGYLLHEFDKWIDSLPKDQQITTTGKSKKALIRCSFASYNYNDVPPDFNPDQRIRVMVAPFPKHRGFGRWEKFATDEDIGKALHIMLPSEPLADYRFYSFSFYGDGGPQGIPAGWSASPAKLTEFYHQAYQAGFRALIAEIDLNFGKDGLGYYLISKLLWNAQLSAGDLDHLRDRWFQRSFGSAWREMKVYYDFLLPENYPINTPNTWAQAIRLLDAADKKLAKTPDAEAQRRLDDVKQYWYVHYLFDSGKYTLSSPEVLEFLWKGQMAYMVGMQGLLGREYKTAQVVSIVGPKISSGPAHYTHEETQAWWKKILDCWTITPVTLFANGTLSNGKPSRNIDLNDLVQVRDFQGPMEDAPFFYDSVFMKPMRALVTAGEKDQLIGFKLVWPFIPNGNDYAPKKVAYGVDIWNPAQKTWQPWIDKTTTVQASAEIITEKKDKVEAVSVRLKAPRPGVYRFDIGYGGNLSFLASMTYDPTSGKYEGPASFTFFTNAEGLTQPGVYFYIPKGTKSVDMDVWDASKIKHLTLYKGLPNKSMTISRQIDVNGMGVHSIPLNPGEDGSFALLEGDNFNFPFLYSIPMLWAKSPSALLVPRSIAEADGLTIMASPHREDK